MKHPVLARDEYGKTLLHNEGGFQINLSSSKAMIMNLQFS